MSHPIRRPDVDVLVAGGGPVGLAAAIGARLAGLRVTLVEPRPGPVDKACGEGLMPSARQELDRLGVTVPGREFHGIAYRDPGHAADAMFSRGPGLGVRRIALSRALAERADQVGVRRVTGRVEGPRPVPGGVRVGDLHAGWLLAADGLHSSIRRSLALEAPRRGRRRFGLRRHYALAPWSDLVEVHWADELEAYLTPVAADCVGLAVLGPPGGDLAGRLAAFEDLAARLAHARPVSAVRGAGPLRRATTARSAGRVLLLGDAAGYVDALTGEGLSVGLAGAAAAVEAVRAGDPEVYERSWRRITRRSRWLTEGLLTLTGWPAARRRLVPAAQRLPGVFTAAVDLLA